MQETPKLLHGTIPLTFHLLGPNFRPVQVTSSLESFWKNGYAEVRKELRIRYPKHQWPEDPADGTPEAKGRRRH
ncbi:ATP-dependent RNA helicase HrpB [compost metagenome]